jgi:hypothetical protein
VVDVRHWTKGRIGMFVVVSSDHYLIVIVVVHQVMIVAMIVVMMVVMIMLSMLKVNDCQATLHYPCKTGEEWMGNR